MTGVQTCALPISLSNLENKKQFPSKGCPQVIASQERKKTLEFILLNLRENEFIKEFSKELAEAMESAARNQSFEYYDKVMSKWEAITEIEISETTQDALKNFEAECDNYDIYPLA
mgnify:CR=1 FL=1